MKNKGNRRMRSRSATAEVWHNFVRNKGAVVGLVVLGLIVTIAIFGAIFIDYQSIVSVNPQEMLQHPSLQHPFGTDQYGRDIMFRIIYGARYSLSVGLVAVFIALAIGGFLGMLAGNVGGVAETIIMRGCDVFASIPSLLLAISISTALGSSTWVLMLAVGLVSVPAFARVARASVMTVRDKEFVEASRAVGASNMRILFTHIIPNAMAPVIVQATMRVGTAIIVAASLSFLGMGVPIPAPEWGAMLSDGRSMIRDYSYMTVFPGLAIMITVLSINLIGDALRDAMDPKLKR
ncbi:MAG TPA: ABC transporter permease [Bacillota bacterium]|nr:ABC transporter permease [Bacillota bacterium]